MRHGRVGVGDHEVGADHLAAGQYDTRGSALLHLDARDVDAEAEAAALCPDQTHQAIDQLPGPAHGEVDAPTPLEIGDQAIDGAGSERVAADQQRVKAEHRAQPLVADEPRHHLVNGTVSGQAQQVGCDLEHRSDTAERHMTELLEADPANGPAVSHEALVARDVVRCEARDLGAHAIHVAAVREGCPVGEADPVERIHRHQRHIVRELATGELPEFLEKLRGRDDRRTGIEGEAVQPVDPGTAPGLGQAFEDGDAVAPRTQTDRGGETPEA